MQVGYTFEIETQISVVVFVWEALLERNERMFGLLYPQTQPQLAALSWKEDILCSWVRSHIHVHDQRTHQVLSTHLLYTVLC